jgi:parallel beta-helix repeat protein
MKYVILLAFGFAAAKLAAQTTPIELSKGLMIKQSCTVKTNTYELVSPGAEDFTPPIEITALQPTVRIEGSNIVVDFQDAVLAGATTGVLPNAFKGMGIMVRGKNITLKNLRVQGYKIAIFAMDVDSLILENCDVSYNYRPKLYSVREREVFSDWLSYHNNDKEEWLRYGAGIYLKNCSNAVVKNCRATGNQNALLMSHCNGATVFNNVFQFNSGLGIGLYRSSNNKLMHNKLDWNVRGYSHGFYQRGQDSAGILLYEQSSDNLIAFNSATHSGDGLFLWAGQSTMDTGKGGCNDNWIFGNDFSYAPTNGIEVTFSRNRVQGNLMRECTYGIWGGYSYESVFSGNMIANCKNGLAIEHGQDNKIVQNLFVLDSTAIQLWGRPTQPADWGYAQNRDVRSRNYTIDHNVFLQVRNPLKISASKDININGINLFYQFQELLLATQPNENLKFVRNEIYAPAAQVEAVWKLPALTDQRDLNFNRVNKTPEDPYAPLQIRYADLKEPDSLPGGINAGLPEGFPQGRKFIMVNEWGPYDFRRPIALLDTIAGDQMSIVLLGPSGTWQLKSMQGVKSIDTRSGTLPATLTLRRHSVMDWVTLELAYIGKRDIVDLFGKTIPAGQVYTIDFQYFGQKVMWDTRFYNFPSTADSCWKNPAVFKRLIRETPLAEKKGNPLEYAWWGAPATGVQADHFASVSEAELLVKPGDYILELCSDDGARLFLDDQLLMEHWDIHEASTRELKVTLKARNRLRIEHFDAGGFATLDFKIKPVK